jgi:hypothetical protein
VVLQEQSQLPSFPDQVVQSQVYPYAAQLSDLIKSTNACGNVIFYMTWGRKNGDNTRCNAQPEVCTYEGMDNLIYQRYVEMAQTNEALLSQWVKYGEPSDSRIPLWNFMIRISPILAI